MPLVYGYNEYNITKTKLDYPVSLFELKRHLRIEPSFSDDDEYLNDLIKVATTSAENYIEKDIAKTLNVLNIKNFSGSHVKIYDGFFNDYIGTYDSNDASIGEYNYVIISPNYFSINYRDVITTESLTIKYYTGFTSTTIDPVIKQAILIEAGNLFDVERNSYTLSGITRVNVFERLLSSYKMILF